MSIRLFPYLPVKDQHRRVLQKNSGHAEPLGLATGEGQPPGADDRIVALDKPGKKHTMLT